MGGNALRIAFPDADWLLQNHEQRIAALQKWGDERSIYVGTVGVDGVDALITPESPPFQNSWTNTLGVDAPVSFRRTLNGWVHLEGGFTGGADNTTVFTFPVGFRPLYRKPFIIPTSSPSHYATGYVDVTGDVVFGTII